jgi:hypothetical protein
MEAAHIDSQDVADVNLALFGPGDYVLPLGARFALQQQSVNLVRIQNGVALMQGRRVIQPAGTTEDLVIENGTAGATRRDLIAIRYAKDPATFYESAEFVVIKGTDNRPEDPANNSNTVVRDGAMVHDMLLYRANISASGGVTLVPLFTTLPQVYQPGGIPSSVIGNGTITSDKLAENAIQERLGYPPANRVELEQGLALERQLRISADSQLDDRLEQFRSSVLSWVQALGNYLNSNRAAGNLTGTPPGM